MTQYSPSKKDAPKNERLCLFSVLISYFYFTIKSTKNQLFISILVLLFNKGKQKKIIKSSRNGWKYIGVWERSPENQRLHFHGLFYISEGTMPGIITQVNDYSFKSHNRQITMQNSYFLQNFGRNDFEVIEDKTLLS